MKKDYYEILGVPKTATEKEIRTAYRRLAKQYHPDRNRGDAAAEERFKEVAEAFAVLSDADKRSRYDQRGHDAFGPGFDPFAGFDLGQFDLGFGDLSSLFGMFGFGGPAGHRAGPRRGSDARYQLTIPFVTAVLGGTVEFAIPGAAAGPQRLKVRIPAGIDEGGTLRLAGKGNPGPPGTPSGDGYLKIHVEPHPVFRREGRDLVGDVSVGLAQAALGGPIEVTTLEGKATVSLPPGTRSGQRLRLRGRGVPAGAGQPAGDLYVAVQIHPPKQLDPRSRELLEEFARLNPRP